MSNLSELLPAGGADKEFSAVASGTLSNGQTVILNSDGTVSAVAETTIPTSIGSESVFGDAVSGAPSNVKTIYDKDNSRFIVGWYDGYGYKLRIGTVSGTTINWGSITTKSGGYGDLSIAYDSTQGYLLLIEVQSSWDVRVGTISGTTISLSGNLWGGRSDVYDGLEMSFDKSSGRVLAFAARDNSNSQYLTCVPFKINSGSSISIGTATTIISNPYMGPYNDVVYDEVNEQTILATFQSSGTPSGSAFSIVPITDSGSGGVSVGTRVNVGTSTNTGGSGVSLALSQNSSGNTGIVLCAEYSGSNYPLNGYAFSVSGGTLTVSSTSRTFETNRTQAGSSSICYSPTSDKYVARWDRQASTAYYSVATVSGTTISSSNGVLNSSNPYSTTLSRIDIDTNTNKVFLPYGKDVSGTRSANYKLLTPAALVSNSADFIGITQEAIADTATGLVTPQGGVNTSVSSLTTGSDYYVQNDGTLSTTVSSVPAGRALSTTSILLEG